MIIFYPPQSICSPVIIADMMDSSDRWSVAEIQAQALRNKPDWIVSVLPTSIYSCKYHYSMQHNGVPLGSALKMAMTAAIFSPPSGLISQVSVDFVSTKDSVDQMADALAVFANPQFKIMTAVIVERTATTVISRSFVAYSVVLQPDEFGTNATLFIQAASFNDSLIKADIAFQLNTTQPLKIQLTEFAAKHGFTCVFSIGVAENIPITGRLFQPTTLPKIIDEVCLQNKIIYTINDKLIAFYPQNSVPAFLAAKKATNVFSFLGFAGNLIWGVGVENYANVKFKTPIFDAQLFDKITIYNDSKSALFQGFKKASSRVGTTIPESYDAYIIRYAIDRSDSELICEVTATNNWLLAQMRVDGIFESKIFGAAL